MRRQHAYTLIKQLAVAALVAAAGSATLAAPSEAEAQILETRALGHIAAFPGFTLHGPGHSYLRKAAIVDGDGAQHVRFDRAYRGMRVIGGDLVVHSDRGGNFRSVSQTLARLINVAGRAGISAADAAQAALAAHPGDSSGTTPELVVYARGDLPVLAYDVRVFGEQADGTPSEKHVIVDAGSAAVLDAWDDVHTAPAIGTGHSLFDGTVTLNTSSTARRGFSLTDTTRGNSKTQDMNGGTRIGKLFTDADNEWGNGSTSDRATVAVDAAYGGAVTWDYYESVHGRIGIGDDGVGANSRVHYGNNYANAFWSDSCFCMTYGDGNASIKPLVSLDVAGHEMTHGVTSRTAGLIYSGESGGLNEATSDIMGTNVEFYAGNANDPGDYLIGEKLFSNGNVIRNMTRPSADGASSDCWYSSVGSLDVHYSSGVANHFYFLLAEGTTSGSPSPTCVAGNTRVATGTGTLAGIGRDKAEKIWYRALTVYMTASTNYSAARTATLDAAADLYGAGSPEVNAVADAWTAVNRP